MSKTNFLKTMYFQGGKNKITEVVSEAKFWGEIVPPLHLDRIGHRARLKSFCQIPSME